MRIRSSLGREAGSGNPYEKTLPFPEGFFHVFALIGIDVSADARISFRNTADGHFVETAVVHVLDDDVVAVDSSDDADVAVVRVVAASGKRDDRSGCRGLARGNSGGCRVAEPLVGVTAPGDVLIVGDVVGTVAPGEALAVAGVTDSIRLGRLFRRDLRREFRVGLLGGQFRVGLLSSDLGIGLLGFFLLRYRKAYAARNDEGLSDFEIGPGDEAVLFDDLVGGNLELVGNRLDGIQRFDGVYDAGNRRNLYGLADAEGISGIEAIRPNDGIDADAEFLRNDGEAVSGPHLIGDEAVDSREVAFVVQYDSRLHETGILREERFGRIVFVRGDNRGFVIIPYGRFVREPEGRERRIDRKDENDECGKDLEPPDDPEYSVLLKYVASASVSLETGPYVHFEPHSENLGIKIPTADVGENRARTWELIATLP